MGSKKVKRKFKANKKDKSSKKKSYNVKRLNSGFDISTSQLLSGFTQIRENYFKYLQNVIEENLKSANNQNLPNNSLEKISLEVEQPALLACMQSEIYQQIMIKIIHDIKSSTQQMKLHLGIKKILLSKTFEDTEISPRLNRENKSHKSNTLEEAANGEIYSRIPTISSIRANYNELNQGWSVQNLVADEYGSFVDVDNLPCQTDTLSQKNIRGPLSVSCEAQDIMQPVYSPSTGKQYVSLYNSNSPKYSSPMIPVAQNGNLNNVTGIENNYGYISRNLVPVQTTVNSEVNYNVNVNKTNSLGTRTTNDIQLIPPFKIKCEEPAQTPESLNHHQSSREASLTKDQGSDEEFKREKLQSDEQLENVSEDETDVSDSLSDNYYDDTYGSETRRGSLLADRLEEMRRLFGIRDSDEENTTSVKNEVEVSGADKYARGQKVQKPNAWYHEKTMNLYRLSRMVSELTPELRKEKRNRLYEYFGEDSDEENETGYVQEEKFLLSCKERISHWVVKYLMPFYQCGRIVGRNVFKVLGHHVSNSVIHKTPYPDEWTVKYVVSKYFMSDKSFSTESDVWSFQPDL